MKLRYLCLRPGAKLVAPRYNDKRGWTRGTKGVLWAFVDNRNGAVRVVPYADLHHGGPEVTVRPATRAEADAADYGLDRRGQSKGAGWKVACSPKRRK